MVDQKVLGVTDGILSKRDFIQLLGGKTKTIEKGCILRVWFVKTDTAGGLKKYSCGRCINDIECDTCASGDACSEFVSCGKCENCADVIEYTERLKISARQGTVWGQVGSYGITSTWGPGGYYPWFEIVKAH